MLRGLDTPGLKLEFNHAVVCFSLQSMNRFLFSFRVCREKRSSETVPFFGAFFSFFCGEESALLVHVFGNGHVLAFLFNFVFLTLADLLFVSVNYQVVTFYFQVSALGICKRFKFFRQFSPR